MRVVVLGIVVLLISACGINRHPKSWPAKVTSVEGFSEAESIELKSALEDLNLRAGQDLVVLDGAPAQEDALPIRIQRVSNFPGHPERVGFASLNNEECVIEIHEKLFGPGKEDSLKTVSIHEVGHCAGYEHVSAPREIMSPAALPFSVYDEQAIDRFFDKLRELIS